MREHVKLCALRIQATYLSHTVLVLVSHVPCDLRAPVPHVLRALRASSALYITCSRASRVLYPIHFRASHSWCLPCSSVSRGLCSAYYRVLSAWSSTCSHASFAPALTYSLRFVLCPLLSQLLSCQQIRKHTYK